MRALALVTDAFGGHGGIAQFNRYFLAALASSSEVEGVCVLPRSANQISGTLPAGLSQAPPSPGRAVYVSRAFQTAVTRGPFDVIFCGHLFMAPLAAALSRLLGARLWLQLHGIEAWRRPGRLIQNGAAQATLITAVSRYTRRRFLGWADVSATRVRVLPNTVDPRFAPGRKPIDLASKLDVKDRKILLTVSRLAASERYNGHDRVIRVLPRVLARHPSAAYVVAGDGDDRSRLERLAEECGVASALRFTGQIADDELPSYYRLADAFVMPSSGEGFGIVYLEAAASGVPVIAGNGDGSIDALADGRIGTAVDPEDAEAFMRAIIAALDSSRPPDPDAVARFCSDNFMAHVDDLVRALR